MRALGLQRIVAVNVSIVGMAALVALAVRVGFAEQTDRPIHRKGARATRSAVAEEAKVRHGESRDREACSEICNVSPTSAWERPSTS